MLVSQKTLRRGAATSAVVLAFTSAAPAFSDDLGFLKDSAAVNHFRANMDRVILEATGGDTLALGQSGTFSLGLEKKLRAPVEKPQLVTVPQEFTRSMLVVGGVVPPASQYATASAPFCIQRSGAILYKGHVSSEGGMVRDSSSLISATEDPDRPCRAWLISQGKAMMQRSAQQQAEQKAVSRPSASLATATPNG